ncbi:elongator complex protein 1 [Ceratobasidium sp. AG-Ba]|nr:elongator complex protein 1 [Ceratobasidium sp. AG-Ba]
MLDGYDAFTTVGRTSGHKINSVMVRSTKPGFPDVVDDRYRELMNTYRKWLYITKLHRSGHLLELHPKLDVHPGDQAFDCVACPRPEFNFSWTEVAEDESYDGNFRAYRKNKKVDAGDVCFSDGLAYFPPKEEYEKWVKSQPEPKKSQEKPTCNNHKAGKDNSVKFAGRDITGIGAFTCTSHSCVAPRGMVNFFKGERQIYCDFAFGSMYKYLSAQGELPVGMTYDIWCHWWTNFWRRMANLPPLYQIPENLDITGAIPKWHLLGHHRLCWILYSLDHKQFVGRLEGEGPERVWAHFNEHSGSTSEQGPGMRLDTWSNVACDWGFVKVTEMHRTLPARFREAKKAHSEQLREHENLTGTFTQKKIREWESESIEPKDENNNGNWTTPLMDPVLKGGYYETLREERESETKAVRLTGRRSGAVRWIADGIELEHSLQNLKDEQKSLGSTPTARQAELLNSRRIALRDRIDVFMQKRVLHMLEIEEPDEPRPLQFVGEDGEWAEPIELGLPSSYKSDTLARAGILKLAEIEKRLRRGVCTDALESVKRLLGGKAAAIKFKNQHLSGQIATTRAESTIQKHTVKILKARQRYLSSRDALLKLDPTENDLDQYRDLRTQDLQPLKTYFEEYAQTTGHGKTSMSWIWRSTAAPNKEDWQVDGKKGTLIPFLPCSI